MRGPRLSAVAKEDGLNWSDVRRLIAGQPPEADAQTMRVSVERNPEVQNNDGKSRSIVVRGEKLSSTDVCWIAGPRFVQSTSQLVAVASALENLGGRILRAEIFSNDPNELSLNSEETKQYLRVLRAAAERFKLYVATSVNSLEELRIAAEQVDIIECGADLIWDPLFRRELGNSGKTVMLRRTGNMEVEDFLDTVKLLERQPVCDIILSENASQNGECHDGSLDVSGIITLRSRTSHPVIVDCTASGRNWNFAEKLAAAAISAGADGLVMGLRPAVVESSAADSRALLPEQLSYTMKRVEALKYTLNALALYQDKGEF